MNSQNSFRIRVYTSQDRKQLLELIKGYIDYFSDKSLYRRAPQKPGLARFLTDKLLRSVKNKKGVLYLAESEREVVGFIGAYLIKQPHWETFETEEMKIGYISKLFIKEKLRGSGIGEALLARAEEHFKKLGVSHIRLFVSGPNVGAHTFYEKHGFINWNVEMIKKI